MNDNETKLRLKFGFLFLISLVIIIGLFFFSAIKQDPSYHQFVDQRALFGIPNFLNVMSNIAFLIIGVIGVTYSLKNNALIILAETRVSYLIFFTGISLVSIGSGYYHLNPSNQSLVWDRLPMTIAFMAFFSITISEFISRDLGKKSLIPLLVIGLFSIWYWNYTEQNNAGDLRIYVLVQFLPMVLIPLILLLFRSRFSQVSFYWYFIVMYGLAKLTEMFDLVIYNYLDVISGHSIKHILASLGCIIFFYHVKNRHLSNE